jgi:hypothetical protein
LPAASNAAPTPKGSVGAAGIAGALVRVATLVAVMIRKPRNE